MATYSEILAHIREDPGKMYTTEELDSVVMIFKDLYATRKDNSNPEDLLSNKRLAFKDVDQNLEKISLEDWFEMRYSRAEMIQLRRMENAYSNYVGIALQPDSGLTMEKLQKLKISRQQNMWVKEFHLSNYM